MTLEFGGNILCSAGVSYFHVYPNGDVYRCLADYNARRPPMFNLKRDGWKGAVDPTVCDHERCYNACDLDWTTKWQVDGQGRLEKTFEGQRKDIEKEVSLFLCSQRLESPQRRMAYFIWSLKYGKAASANPWNATGLEWQTESPPPQFNFDTTPVVEVEAYSYSVPVRSMPASD